MTGPHRPRIYLPASHRARATRCATPRPRSLEVLRSSISGLATTIRTPRRHARWTVASLTDVDPQGADVVVLPAAQDRRDAPVHPRPASPWAVAVVVEMDDLLSAVPFGNPLQQHRPHGHARLGAAVRPRGRPRDDDDAGPRRGVRTARRRRRRPQRHPARIAELPPAYERRRTSSPSGAPAPCSGHPYDLQEMRSGLQQAAGQHPRPQPVPHPRPEVRTRGERLRLAEEPAELPVDPRRRPATPTSRSATVFDIGVAPLRIDRFNTCKSWLKNLQYAARGVYCVRLPQRGVRAPGARPAGQGHRRTGRRP